MPGVVSRCRIIEPPQTRGGRSVTRSVVAALGPLILVSAAWALDEPKDKADPPAKSTAAEKLKALQQKMQKTRTDLQAKLREAEKDEEKAELRKELAGLPQKFAK